jgi:hypothetical protein
LYFIKKNPTFVAITVNSEIGEVYRMRADVGQIEGMGNGEEEMWAGE